MSALSHPRIHARSVRWLAALVVSLAGTACGGQDAGGTAGSVTSSTAGRSGDSSAGDTQSGSTTSTTACTNGVDDDGDGSIDGFDPECTGSLDDDEGSFATGIPGDNRDPKWQDCFFDGNSGAGDDGCRYPTGCLTGELAASDPACAVTQQCLDFCRRLTPNGCDCFGCCTIELANGSTVDVTLSDSCSVRDAGDPRACAPCQKSNDCHNDCGECELCAGKTAADLPSSCQPPPDTNPPPNTEPPPSYTCDNGETVCGPDLPACPDTEFCSLGCCLPQVR